MSTADEHRVGSDPSEQLDTHVRAAPGRLHAVDVLTVAAGGAVGSLARYSVTLVLPVTAGFDWPLLAVNLVGALCLGFLIEMLSRHQQAGGEPERSRRLRLVVGTGFLGGFTTYSALVVGTLDPTGPTTVAGLQLVVIVAGGLLAAGFGVRLGAWAERGRS